MLRWLRVENVAVIEALEVDFESRLNILTGETGAGKSILIDALGLVLGDRASADLIRTGASSAIVEAGFLLEPVPAGLAGRLEDAGIGVEDELVVRREITSSGGRGKIAVNGSAGSRALLRDMAPFLVDVHGQGENLSLLQPESALDLLDSYGGSWQLRGQVRDAFNAVTEAQNRLQAKERSAQERESKREFNEFILSELDKAELREGEDDELERERTLVAHAEKLKQLSTAVYEKLYEDEASILSALSAVYKNVDELAAIDDRWAPHAREREAIAGPLEDLALSLRDYADDVDVTPGRLDTIESRLAALERLKKKYGGTLEAVLEKRDACRRELAEIEGSDESLEALRAELVGAESKYQALATELSRMRSNAASRLKKAVSKELPTLALAKAQFSVALSTVDARETGTDAAELMFSANPGESQKPLARVASGGELSRFMLALKSVSAKDDTSKALVFDEVDAGIGGRVADAVGIKLAELAELHQVICVTHLPQIASFAPAHYRIDKMERRGRIETKIVKLEPEARIEEIARMLAGAVVSESAREHARQLVENHGS